jgi:hypothetical protein
LRGNVVLGLRPGFDDNTEFDHVRVFFGLKKKERIGVEVKVEVELSESVRGKKVKLKSEIRGKGAYSPSGDLLRLTPSLAIGTRYADGYLLRLIVLWYRFFLIKKSR